MKFLLPIVACSFAIIGLFVVSSDTATEASAVTEPTPTPTPSERWYAEAPAMPEELKYLALFEEIQMLKSKDQENQQAGETSYFKKSFYDDRLKLNSSQYATMDTVAADCMAQLQPLEQQARQIIEQYRAAYPNGKLKKVQPSQSQGAFQSVDAKRTIEPLPPVPNALIQLNTQRNQIILSSKEQLRQAFGTSAFAAFDNAVQENARKVLRPLNMGSNQLPRLTPTPTPTPGS